MLGAVLAMTSLAPASSAAPSQGSGSQAPAQQGAQQEAPQEAQQGAQEQVLVFTAGDSVTDYMSVPSTATAGPATIVFENSANTGNTTGMPHTLSFSTTREGYNHDVDVDIVAEYGVSIADLATGIRRNVVAAIERMTGLEVTEVNITVHDVHLDDDDDGDAAGQATVSRVQ